MAKMDKAMMAAPMTGDPDHDFAAMMIPHHQGAVDMAKVVLLHGKDPVLRRLAQEIIVTQRQEIEVMRLRLMALKGSVPMLHKVSLPTQRADRPSRSGKHSRTRKNQEPTLRLPYPVMTGFIPPTRPPTPFR